MSSFLGVVENSLSQPRAKYPSAMPLDFRDPFVFCVFPGALCGNEKNGEFQTVVPRLVLLGVGPNKSDDRYRVGHENVSFFCPFFRGTQKRGLLLPMRAAA